MFSCSPRTFILFICIGLLAFHEEKVCCLRSTDLAPRQSGEDHRVTIKNQRILKATVVKGFNTDKKPARVSNKVDPNQSSKRKVGRGSNPIHNRT